MHFVQLNTAVSMAFELPVRPDNSGATFTVVNPSGGVVQSSASATVNTVNTSLNGAVAAGATSVTVTSATGVRVGGRYIIGRSTPGSSTREDLGGEVVVIKSLSGTIATLTQPLRYAHASGECFQSREITCAVSSSTPSAVGRHWRIEVTYAADDGTAASSVTQPVHVESFDVVRFVPVSNCTWNDVLALDPVGSKRLPAGLWWPQLRDATWDMILRRLGAKLDAVGPGALVGVLNFTTAHAYLARSVLAETSGQDPEQVAYRELMAQRFGEEFEAATAVAPIDNDGDGAIESNEGVSMHTIDLRRA